MKVGDRVRIHPASDWFMKGERYATIVKVSRSGRLHVRGERSGRVFRLATANVIEVME